MVAAATAARKSLLRRIMLGLHESWLRGVSMPNFDAARECGINRVARETLVKTGVRTPPPVPRAHRRDAVRVRQLAAARLSRLRRRRIRQRRIADRRTARSV